MYIMVYYLNPNNIHNIVRTNLNITNWVLADHISISLDIESIEIRK